MQCTNVLTMAIGDDNTLTDPAQFFLEPGSASQRQYEALRAYFIGGLPSAKAARAFGYSPGAFRVLCSHFRHDPGSRAFFRVTSAGRPPGVRRHDPVRSEAVALRKKNYSVHDIAQAFAERGVKVTPAAVRDILREEGFAPLPRRLDEDRPSHAGPAVQPAADARAFSLETREFETQCGGLFLFVPDLVRLAMPELAVAAGLPGSKVIPPSHALLAMLALKLWSIERKSHVMALVADSGLALFAGLNAIPKKSFLSEYSHRLERRHTLRLLGAWQDALAGEDLVTGESLNLDFHSVPYGGEHPVVEKHFVAMRSRRQPSMLAFLAQDASSNVFCYSNADLRKGEESEEVFRFLDFWQEHHDGALPKELVFDSKLTTYAGLARLDALGVPFITLRRRDARLLAEARALPPSAWRVVPLEHVARKFRTPRVFEQVVTLAKRPFRQLFVEDLGHEEPTILLTNQAKTTAKRLLTRYAQRMLIENALSDAVRFFHMNALSSAVALKVDFDLALLVMASALYRRFARRMRGYADAQARQIFRDLVDLPATVKVTPAEVRVTFHRRAHIPILLASDLLTETPAVPWWNGAQLTLQATPDR
jgi:transposase